MCDTQPPLSIQEHFGALPDPRIDRQKRHNLIDITTITLCAVLCGAEAWTHIEEFGKAKEDWFRTFLELPNNIPSHDTFGRFFSLLDPQAFQEAFTNWVQAVNEVFQGQVIPIDGKCLRRSHDHNNNKSAIYMVSAWASANECVLGHLVKNRHDGKLWNIPFCHINLDHADVSISGSTGKLDRNSLKVGDKVAFKDRKGNELFGEVIKLNQKTVGVLVGTTRWKVGYRLLSSIIEGDLGSETNLIEGQLLARE